MEEGVGKHKEACNVNNRINLNLPLAIGEETEERTVEKPVVDWIVDGEEGVNSPVPCLVGRLWTERNVNLNAMMDTMMTVWKTRNKVQAEIVDKQRKIVTFMFHDESDKKRVLEEQPWHFERHILILADLKGDAIPTEVPLFFSPMWIRVYNLPTTGRKILENAMNIGSALGTFLEIDNSVNPEINRSMRIRIIVDVRRALVESITMRGYGGRMWEVKVRYERLPLFCYVCGRMGHGEKDCGDRKGRIGEGRRYGDWLKASPWRAAKPQQGSGEGRESCAKKLFVEPDEQKVLEEEELRRMVELLRGTSLNEDNNNSQRIDHMGRNVDSDEGAASDQSVTNGEGACAGTVDSSATGQGGMGKEGRKMIKVKRKKAKEGRQCSWAGDNMGQNRPKRKWEDVEREEPAEINDGTRRRLDDMTESMMIITQVADPDLDRGREQQ